MKKEIEYRNITLRSLDEESREIEGFVPYNSLSEDMGFREQILPGAFSKSLAESKDIRCLYSHDDGNLLARTSNQSLSFIDGEDGLRFRFNAPETTLGNDVLTMVRSGLLSGCSFGFSTISDQWHLVGGEEVRDLIEVRLYEVSIVGTPAYPASRVSKRSLSSFFDGKDLTDEDKKSVEAEIEKLQALLPHKEEEHREEPQPPAEEHKEEDDPEIQALYDRLVKAEETIKELEGENP